MNSDSLELWLSDL